MSTSSSNLQGDNSIPASQLVPQPFSALHEVHQALSHEYGRFHTKPTKIGGQRIRKHLSMLQKQAKEMRGGVLATMKAMPKAPRSTKSTVAVTNPEIKQEVLETAVNDAVNMGANPRTGSGKSAKPKKTRVKKQV
jgi:hypothetical protein